MATSQRGLAGRSLVRRVVLEPEKGREIAQTPSQFSVEMIALDICTRS